MDADLAQSLLAGWIAGALDGLIAAGGLVAFVARQPALAGRLPARGRLLAVGMIGANALVFGLTLLGLILGALFHRAGGEEVAVRFGLVAGAGLLGVGALYAFVRGRLRTSEAPAVLMILVVSALSFGVVLPVLGSLDR